MRAGYPALQGYLGARLRAIHQSVLDFESSVIRLPSELADLLHDVRTELETVVARYEEQRNEVADDPELSSDVDSRYLAFSTVAAFLADRLTTGTDPDEVPPDLHAVLVDLFGPRPAGHAIVLRAVDNSGFQTYQLWRPALMRRSDEVMDQLRAGRTVGREPWLVSVFDIPRSLRSATLTQLVMLGHELPHAQDTVANLAYRQPILDALQLPQGAEADSLTSRLVVAWIDEVLADIASVRFMGPAAILVFAEYARLAQAYGYQIPPVVWEVDFSGHPPAEVRLHFMFRALDALQISRVALGELAPALDAWRRIGDMGSKLPPDARTEFSAADKLLRRAFDSIQSQAASLVPPHRTYTKAAFLRATKLASTLARGLVCSDELDDQLQSKPVELTDLFNAAALVRWVPRLFDQLMATMGLDDPSALTMEQRRALTLLQLDDLLARAIEGHRIRLLWPANLFE